MPAKDFLKSKIDAMADTPMQRKLRKIAPMPIGCVFLPWPGMTEQDAREHFGLMKNLGYTCLKQTMPTPEWPATKTLALALEEGIVPFWYAEGGYEDITPALLKKLGLSPKLSIDEAMKHPKMIAYQTKVFAARIDRTKTGMAGLGESKKKKGETEQKDKYWVPGMVGDVRGHELHPDALPAFVEWLKKQYRTVDKLKDAWNYWHVGIGSNKNNWQTWDEVLAALKAGVGGGEYRRTRDMLAFRAETFTQQHITDRVDEQQELDPHEPIRAGGEMGLFLSFASRGTDMELIAKEMARGGSFYPSIHLAWHFEEVDFEVARPVYMQAQIAHDWAKGIWSATWESTGGPQYFSGGKSPFVKEAQDKQPGFTTDENTMTQLMLSYLAAGFKGFGLWAWNARTAGWEAGEYALVDRNRKPTQRAITVGKIGQAARKWSRELWAGQKEPVVGILQDWENEAYWAAMAVTGRDFYRFLPVRARVGASRAFINANVPWEYVTARDLQAGLGDRYACIYVPAFISISSTLQKNLHNFVKNGGRLVLDMPGAYYDEFGRVFLTDEGTWFEKTFGCVLNEFSYSTQLNVPYSIDNVNINGFTCVLTPTKGKVVRNYDQQPRPAITEHKLGKGTAVVLAAEASLNCWKPGNTGMENLIVKTTLGDLESPYACDGALCYRYATPTADHYFLINDGPAGSAKLNTKQFKYKQLQDAVTGETLVAGKPINIPGYSGRWVRAVK